MGYDLMQFLVAYLTTEARVSRRLRSNGAIEMKHSKIQDPRAKALLPLLLGASVTALIISAGSAMADDITATDGTASTAVQLDANGLLGTTDGAVVTGLTFNSGGAASTTITGTGGVSVTGANGGTATMTGDDVQVTSTGGVTTAVTGASGVSVTGAAGGVTTLTGDQVQVGAGDTVVTVTSTELTTGSDVASTFNGVANFGGTASGTQFDASGNLQIGQAASGITLNTDGTAAFNALLTANEGIQVGAVTTGVTLNKDGSSTFNGDMQIGAAATGVTINAAQGTVTANGGVQVGSAATGITLNPDGSAVFNGAVSITTDPKNPHDIANKAYVDAGLNNVRDWASAKFKKVNSGIAAAAALQNPDRTGNQTWALAVNEGFWNGASATGFSGITRIGNLGSYDVSFGGAFAVTDRGDVAGRVSAQIAGGGYTPLK
jgi:trimeric autotransporter adhesin